MAEVHLSSPVRVDRSVDAERFAILEEVFSAAEARLSPRIWDFLSGGAGEEQTLRANREAFGRWQFRPRVLSGIAPPTARTTFLGLDLSMPVLTAPFGADALFHPEGHLAIARANQAFGTISMVPGACSFPLETVAREAPDAARIFQLHPVGTAESFLELAGRAANAGYKVLCVTADCPTRGWRERIRRDRFRPEDERDAMDGNYSRDPGEILSQLECLDQPIWTWRELADVCAQAPLPFIVKGILTREDAREAVTAGAKAVVVSNHGGRQLDGVPAALDQLPEIVEEVGGEVEIGIDGGIRRATDIVKALALGADVVVIGRLTAMGLAAGGEAGVRRVLELLYAELLTTMALAGRESIRDLDRSLLQRAPSH